MFAILKKEIRSFFASPIGYLVIAIFLLLTGLAIWVFKGEMNILDNGFADLSSFFTLAPWIFIFLVPAITMRSFADEKKQGTLEILLTKPVSVIKIVLGKFFGYFLLILLALLPTFIYVYSVYQLGNPIGNLDTGSIIGSYFGLVFIAAAYTSIGVFSSSITDNQIVAFVIGVFLCFFMYYGFEGLSEYNILGNFHPESLGMDYHYSSISRGVLDINDFIYFLSITTFFVLLTVPMVRNRRIQKKDYLKISVVLIGLLILNYLIGTFLYARYDLTKDKRYTISTATRNIVKEIESPLVIDVFLEGDFPSGFRKLKNETKQLLEEFNLYNRDIIFNFIDPLEDVSTRESNIENLVKRGMQPMQISVQENGKSSQELMFPWALASYNANTVKIPLLKNKIGAGQEELVSNSIQHLEYAFADGFKKLISERTKKIAILKGNGQLKDIYLTDFLSSIREHYNIAPFTLDSVQNNPDRVLSQLQDFDLIISAKPTEMFTEEEKQVLDQFTMNGGKSLWLTESIIIDKDSLYNESGTAIAIMRDLNLNDFFFKYGVRINPEIVKDMYSAPITLAMGDGSDAQFQPLQWPYDPLAASNPAHPITTNLNRIRFDFASPIDTLKNAVAKTILLKSSDLSGLQGVPSTVTLDIVKEEADPAQFVKGPQNLAILLEGTFTSVYNNRILPYKSSEFKNESIPTKMMVISDGDVIKNEVVNGKPQQLGFDRWTGQLFGNKEFLLNAVNYLLDDDGLINIRTKEIVIPFLDNQKVAEERTKWQFLNIGLPLIILGLFGFVFNYLRRRRYS
ncbi:gliding motility-associated ABC transporter substrate-binding protein GldG [Aegicerativicinus sediminis]|uniref:gliding motility-associated ABC transporter substrate-binding protein GldG n=1 Tax=Aegicerativicinus sediminis TaxID=2893202 RepID=UPI001E55A19A|nr:gliding motility-associated ABC transporter substrate-binding protein GldG [Aegicerativicinus sediminis]